MVLQIKDEHMSDTCIYVISCDTAVKDDTVIHMSDTERKMITELRVLIIFNAYFLKEFKYEEQNTYIIGNKLLVELRATHISKYSETTNS